MATEGTTGDIEFLQHIVYYLSSNNIPLEITEVEQFIRKARCFVIRNKQLFFGGNNSSLRVLENIDERRNRLISIDHCNDSMSKYYHMGKDFYWPHFDKDMGVYAHSMSLSMSFSPARLLHMNMFNHAIYLMIEEQSGFLTGHVESGHSHSFLADFIFGIFCKNGELPQILTLHDVDDSLLHNLKVNLAYLFKGLESMKNNLSVFSSLLQSFDMSDTEKELIHSLQTFIHSENKSWVRKFPGWVYTQNCKINIFSPTKNLKPSLKRSAASVSKDNSIVPNKKKTTANPCVTSKETLNVQESTESVVSTVKSLLSLTKSERSRRGKYYKYDPEIRDAIAEFALTHGATEASKHFTNKLDLKISSSTIRNFIKSYQAYTPEVKEEIGKYALDHGSEKCFEHFKSKFDQNESGEESTFTVSLINRFKKYYESKTTAAKNDDGTTRIFVVDIPVSSSSTPSSAEGPTKNFFNSKLKNDIGQYAYHCGNKKTVEHFSNRLQVPMKESTVRKFKKRWMESNNISPESVPNKAPKSNTLPKEKLSNGATLPEKEVEESREEVGEEDGNEEENSEEDEVNERNKHRLYSSYDPELRAKIAKYAIHHNNKETAEYFKVVYNKIVPRSTIRFLRDKYKSMDDDNEDMTQLDFGPRGRPTRLGCYDSILQKCIIDLAKSGEKLTSFLVIATAKQVLLKYDPSLLKENGGNISLDPNWAKSILRRAQKSLRKCS